jgi:hypothetical protein
MKLCVPAQIKIIIIGPVLYFYPGHVPGSIKVQCTMSYRDVRRRVLDLPSCTKLFVEQFLSFHYISFFFFFLERKMEMSIARLLS